MTDTSWTQTVNGWSTDQAVPDYPSAGAGPAASTEGSDSRLTDLLSGTSRSATVTLAPPLRSPLPAPPAESIPAPRLRVVSASTPVARGATRTPPKVAPALEPDLSPRREATAIPRGLRFVLTVAFVSAIVSGTALFGPGGWWTLSESLTRLTSAVATVAGLVLVCWRTGGRPVLAGAGSTLVLAGVLAYPQAWTLAGASVAAAVTYGVLGMIVTRPAAGLRALGELIMSAVVGLIGAAVVAGFAVEVRPYRERVIVMAFVLLIALALASRLGYGFGSLGRRGVLSTVAMLVILAGAVGYAAAVRRWGSSDFLTTVTETQRHIKHYLHAMPRVSEALVGFPALMWGVSIRRRRRQGWWMCAFGALGSAGLATGFVSPDVTITEAFIATGEGLAIGALLGFLLIGIDRLVTGGHGRRSADPDQLDIERPEVPRFAPFL
jgi:hypothetical protein